MRCSAIHRLALEVPRTRLEPTARDNDGIDRVRFQVPDDAVCGVITLTPLSDSASGGSGVLRDARGADGFSHTLRTPLNLDIA
jgi:hypothetical protein